MVLPKSVLIRFLNYENSLPSSWNTPASSTLFESPRIVPKHLARQEMAESAPDTSWQPDSNKSFLSPCSYLMSDHHGFPQTGARRRAVFLQVMSFHLACLTSLLTGHEMRGQMALNALYRWMAGVQVCWGVGRRWGGACPFHHWSIPERTVPAGVCLFLRARVIDALNRFRQCLLHEGPRKNERVRP